MKKCTLTHTFSISGTMSNVAHQTPEGAICKIEVHEQPKTEYEHISGVFIFSPIDMDKAFDIIRQLPDDVHYTLGDY